MNVKPIKLIIGAPLIFDNLSDDQIILIDANFVNKKDLQFFCKKLTLIHTIVWDKKDILKKWHIYSDSRFNGFENNNNIKINFPNLKLIDIATITTKTLNQILDSVSSINKNETSIDLYINQGDPYKILLGSEDWIYNINSVQINIKNNKKDALKQTKLYLDNNYFNTENNLYWKQDKKEAKNKKLYFLNDKLSTLISLNKIEQEKNNNFKKEVNLCTKKISFLEKQIEESLLIEKQTQVYVNKLKKNFEKVFPFKKYKKIKYNDINYEQNKEEIIDNFINSDSNEDKKLFSGDLIFDELYFLKEKFKLISLEKDSLSAQLLESQENLNSLSKERDSLSVQLSESQKNLNSLSNEKDSLSAQLLESQESLNSLSNEKDSLSSQLLESQENLNSLSRDKESEIMENKNSFALTIKRYQNVLNNLFPFDEYLHLRKDIKELNFSKSEIIKHYLEFGIDENPEFNFKNIITNKIKTLEYQKSIQEHKISELENLMHSSDKEVEIIKELFAKLVSTNKIN